MTAVLPHADRYPTWVRRHSPHVRNAVRGVRRRVGARCVQLARVQRRLDPSGTSIALTFDDGPDPVATPAILDELKRLGVVATFFLVGHRARAHPEIVRRILDEGHQVGSHSDSHPEPWRVPLATIVREYRRGRSEVEWAAQRPVHLFRPPKGHVDNAGALAMVLTGLRPWLWTIDPGDWRPDVRPGDVLAGLDGLRGGDVILLHDAIEGPLAPSALDRSATTAVLRGIVALATERKLHFTTLA